MGGALAGGASYGLGSLMGPSSQAVNQTALAQQQVGQDVLAGDAAQQAANPLGTTSLNAGTGVPTSSTQLPGSGNISGMPTSGAGSAAAQIPMDAQNAAYQSLLNNQGFNSLGGNMPQGSSMGGALGAGAGAALGNQIFGNQSLTSSQLPTQMTKPYLNANQLPSWQQMVGTGNYKGATPNFTGYNPATNYPAAFNFYPTANQPTPPVTTPVG